MTKIGSWRRLDFIGRLLGIGLFFVVLYAFPTYAQDGLLDALPEELSTLGPGQGGELSNTIIQLFALITILSLAPGIAMMVTSFPFFVIVFSIMRQALGIQQAPPNMMIVAISLFIAFFVMEPVFMQAWSDGISPYAEGALNEAEAWARSTAPFREFMTGRTEPNTIIVLAEAVNRPLAEDAEPSFALLATGFMLSEIKHAFQIGFVIFMPFLIIDLVVASILMAVGMMMVPPTVVSLPFKLGFFVLADGWLNITDALLRGFS